MSNRSPFIAAAFFLVAALTPEARATCNAIPDAESVGIGVAALLVAQDPTLSVPVPDPGRIGFKGALGRMDRTQLLPGITTSFRIQPDGRCVHAVDKKLIVEDAPGGLLDKGLAGSDLVVSLLTKPEGRGRSNALVLGSKAACNVLRAGEERGGKDAGVALRCEVLTPEIEGPNVHVRLPDDGGLLAVDGTPLRGSATVVVTRSPQSRAEHVALLSRIAADGCAANCSLLAAARSLACVGPFYAVLASGTVVTDLVPCGVTIPGTISKNKFKEKCEDLPSPDPDLEKCDDDRSILDFWEDACGGVHIPFDWTEIRKDTSTSTDVTRRVAGRSATSRTESGHLSSKRIWVPGREFVGSTPWNDPQGTAATTDWRKPDVEVWVPAESPEEFGLRGSVDQPDSIVHIFPRMPVSLACDGVAGDEACMGVEGGGGISCACRDRYPVGCVCKDVDPPKFFACDGGDFEGMPCTRHQHCNSKPGSPNPDGSCTQKPTCQKDGKQGVWESPGSSAGTACWADGKCTQVAQHPWCGYRLFDISDRKHPVYPKQRQLDAEINTGGRPRRGVCKGDKGKRNKVCNHVAGNNCNLADCDQNATVCECRGYTLRAEGKKP
jgi:hypothetical protein